MFFLIGEERVRKIIGSGELPCPVCGSSQPGKRLAETSYFTFFMIPLLPLHRLSDYWQCGNCGTAFDPSNPGEPSADAAIRRALVYIMMGYRSMSHGETAIEIYRKITDRSLTTDEIRRQVDEIEAGEEDLAAYLERVSFGMNARGKQQVIEAAFLITHACCEIQQADRLRINLMGSAMGVSLEFVEEVINGVRAAGYFGIRRNLITS